MVAQVPVLLRPVSSPRHTKTRSVTLQFYDRASEWYDGYLVDHEPSDWTELVKLVFKRFKRSTTVGALEELKMNPLGAVEEYMDRFERVKSRLLLEIVRFVF